MDKIISLHQKDLIWIYRVIIIKLAMIQGIILLVNIKNVWIKKIMELLFIKKDLNKIILIFSEFLF
jgi:hypothetical protein